jgi:hypothetical protein
MKEESRAKKKRKIKNKCVEEIRRKIEEEGNNE